MAKSDKHIHKLKRVRFKSGNSVYFCALPDCNFKQQIALALGKRSICWRCGQSFIMSEYSMRLAKPHCDACHKPKMSQDDRIHEEESHEANKYEGDFVGQLLAPPTQKAYAEATSLADRLNALLNHTKPLEEEEEI